jgi:hypothetical protein
MNRLVQLAVRMKRAPVLTTVYFRIALPLLRLQPFGSTVLGPVKGSHRSLPEALKRGRARSGVRAGSSATLAPLDPARQVRNTPPILSIPQVPRNFSSTPVHPLPETFVAEFRWGRIATSQLDVISSDDRVFDDLYPRFSDEGNPARSLVLPWLPRLRKQEGTLATIATNRAGNYYHWLNDCLTRLWLLERHGVKNYRLLVPRRMATFQAESLLAAGVSRDRWILFDNEHWLVERLLVPSLVNAPLQSSPEACRWLQDRMLAAVRPGSSSLPKRIYVSRALAQKRRLLNEHEMIPLLERRGFAVVTTESMSVARQMELFHNADVVVAPHGAGLSNSLFMRENALMIELLPWRKAKTCYFSLASALKLRYACITDAPAGGEPPLLGRRPDADFEISPERLQDGLASLGL